MMRYRALKELIFAAFMLLDADDEAVSDAYVETAPLVGKNVDEVGVLFHSLH